MSELYSHVEELLHQPWAVSGVCWLGGVYLAVLVNLLLPKKCLLVCGFAAEAIFVGAALNHYEVFHPHEHIDFPAFVKLLPAFLASQVGYFHAVVFAAGVMFSALGSALVSDESRGAEGPAGEEQPPALSDPGVCSAVHWA
jgi:hypothetical protein